MAEDDILEGDDTVAGGDDTVAAGAGDDTVTATDSKDLLDDGDDVSDKGAGDLLSDDEDADDPKASAPDEYTFEPPEGVELDASMTEALDGFKSTAKDLGLTQDQFQKLVEHDLQRSQDAGAAAIEAFMVRIDEWRAEARLDKTVGGDKFDATIRASKSVLNQFGDAEFKALLATPGEKNPTGFGIGNHPAVLRFLHKVNAALGDPKLLTGDETSAAAQVRSHERVAEGLYPSMKKTA